MNRRKFVKAFGLLSGSLFFWKCGKDKNPVEGNEPPITTVTEFPNGGNANNVKNLELVLRFSNALDQNTVKAQNIYVKKKGTTSQLYGEVSYRSVDGKGEITLKNLPTLDFAADYELVITDTLKDKFGRSLGGNRVYTFTTRASTRIVSFNYERDAQEALSAVIRMTHGLTGDSVTPATVTLKEKSSGTLLTGGAIIYDSPTRSIRYQLPENFDKSKVHTISLENVLDFEGVLIDGDGDGKAGGLYASEFDIAPFVRNITPGDGDVNVAVGSLLSVVFSEHIPGLAVESYRPTVMEVKDNEGNIVEGSYAYDVNQLMLTFTPTGALLSNTGYTATVFKDKVLDVNGQEMLADNVWGFTTEVLPDPGPAPLTGLEARMGQERETVHLKWTAPEDFDASNRDTTKDIRYYFWAKVGDQAYTQPEIADLKLEDAIVKDKQFNIDAGNNIEYDISVENPAEKINIVVEGLDRENNSTGRVQFNQTISKGYTVQGELYDGIKDEGWGSVKLYEGGKERGSTSADGSFSFETAKQQGTISFGDGSLTHQIDMPYNMAGDAADMGRLNWGLATEYPLWYLLHFQGKGGSNATHPDEAWITKWDPNLMNNEGYMRITYVNLPSEQESEIRSDVQRINETIQEATYGKMKGFVLPGDEDNIKRKTTNTGEEEGAYFNEWNAKKVPVWFFSDYLPNLNGPNSQGQLERGPHTATAGPVISFNNTDYNARYSEAMQYLMTLNGETLNDDYKDSIFRGSGRADKLTNNFNYRGIPISAEKLMGAKYFFDIGTKLEANKITLNNQQL